MSPSLPFESTRLPWRSHSPEGWRARIAQLDLNPLEEVALLRLLDWQWVEGSIPADIYRVEGHLTSLGIPGKQKSNFAVAKVMSAFIPLDDARTRLIDDITHQQRTAALELGKARSEIARNAAKVRHRKDDTPDDGPPPTDS